MKAPINEVVIKGFIYDHNLKSKVSGPTAKTPGTPFLTGSIQIATDDQMLNIVKVSYNYVTQYTKSGKPNMTYSILNDIVSGAIPTVIRDRAEKATAIYRVRSQIGLNDFYDLNTSEEKLISVKINDGGLIDRVSVAPPQDPDEPIGEATFNCDIVITKVTRMESDPERGIPEKMILRCAAFNNWSKALLPMDLTVLSPNAMNYFEGLSLPVFTRVRGQEISNTIIKKTEERSPWGEVFTKETPVSRKDYVITWVNEYPYGWGDEASITNDEIDQAKADRELYLAAKKQDQIERSKRKQEEQNQQISQQKMDIAAGDFNYF